VREKWSDRFVSFKRIDEGSCQRDRKLTQSEITASIDASRLPPILTPPEAAQLLRLKVSTLYRHASEGRYAGAIKRGKPLRFWRDRLIQEFMR
jgi:hypothetical protein